MAFAILTVNFSTTRYLTLMLLTLAEQDAPQLMRRIVIVDNGSQDGGAPFLRELSGWIPQISGSTRLTVAVAQRWGVGLFAKPA